MFCPKCRDEFIDGITNCTKCNVPLLKELPGKQAPLKPVYTHLVTILTTSDVALIAVAKSILDEAGIKYFVKGEMLQGVLCIQSGGFKEVAIQVPQIDADDARTLLNF